MGRTCLPQTERGSHDPELCKHCLQNDGKPDKLLRVRVGTWNVESMSGRDTEVCEELRKRMMDVCCLKKLRWRFILWV